MSELIIELVAAGQGIGILPGPPATSVPAAGGTGTDGSEADGARPDRAGGAGADGGPAWRQFATRWGAELGVMAGTAVVYAWGLGQNGLGNPYYAASVRSMDQSWVAAQAPWRRRILHALAGGLAFVVVAGAWIVAVQLTPPVARSN